MKIKLLIIFLLCCCTPTMSGCLIPTRGLRPEVVVKHPDSPMLIIGFEGRFVRVAIYDAQQNKMIEFPELIPLDHCLNGWTFTKYDWQKFLKSKETE